MYILFICFWLIAYLIVSDEFRTKADFWIAITILIFGFGGFGMFLEYLFHENMLPIIKCIHFFSIFMVLLFSGVSLLIYTMYYTNRMPRKPIYSIFVIGLLLIPIFILIHLMYSEIAFSNNGGYDNFKMPVGLITSVISPYFFLSITLLTLHLFNKHTELWKSEVIASYILVVPASVLFYVATFLLPTLGYDQAWKFNIITFTVESILYLYFVINKNALGLSFHKNNSTREKLEKAMIQRTCLLQHAMKNNMQGIKLNLQNARYSYENNGYTQDVVEDISRGLEICLQAQTLLERMTLRDSPILLNKIKDELEEMIKGVVMQSQAVIKKKKVSVDIHIFTHKIADYDRVHMSEVLLNILSNALDAVNDDGTGDISISLSDDNKYLRLQVKDNGCGLSKKHLKSINKSSRMVESSKDTDSHSGLGLYYVKKVIRLHYGKFKIIKDKSGHTIADVLLPIIR